MLYFPLGGFSRLQSDTLSAVAERRESMPFFFFDVGRPGVAAPGGGGGGGGERSPNILLIPGTSSVAHLRENVAGAALTLSEDDLAELDGMLTPVPAHLPVRMTDRMQVAHRANVPPFHVMDLLAAAQRRQATPRRPGQLRRRPAVDRRAEGGARGGQAAARRGGARLHRRDRHPRAARGDRRPPPAYVGIDVTLDDVVITTGSSGGFLLAFLAAFEPGDRVVMARPGYACYRNVLTALGCEVVEIDCGPETRFQPTVEQLDARRRDRSPGS